MCREKVNKKIDLKSDKNKTSKEGDEYAKIDAGGKKSKEVRDAIRNYGAVRG